jgi:hypothetical protein
MTDNRYVCCQAYKSLGWESNLQSALAMRKKRAGRGPVWAMPLCFSP